MTLRQCADSRWYALYVKSRSEKKVSEALQQANIDHYLPLRKELRQWSDRKKKVEAVVFPGYLFVKIKPDEDVTVLSIPNAVCFIRFGGKLEPIPDKQICDLRKIVEYWQFETATYDRIKVGDIVRIAYGPLKGIEGELLEGRAKCRVLVKYDQIAQSIVLDIEKKYLELPCLDLV